MREIWKPLKTVGLPHVVHEFVFAAFVREQTWQIQSYVGIGLSDRSKSFGASAERSKADASRVIHPSRLDTALDIPCKLSAKDQILGADCDRRAQEQGSQLQDI
jgi:hypothetical protein